MKPIPVEVREEIITALRSGLTRREASERFGVSEISVIRFARRDREGRGMLPREPARRGPIAILDEADTAWLQAEVARAPEATREELAARLHTERGKAVSIPTLSRALRLLGVRKVRPVLMDATPLPPERVTRYRAQHRREPARGAYPTDLTDSEWCLLEPIFTEPRRRGRPAVHSPRAILDAIFYVVRSGCSWRMLPTSFPAWQAVYACFRRWARNGRIERMHGVLRSRWRERENRVAEPSAGVIDSQSVKTTEKGGSAGTTGRRR